MWRTALIGVFCFNLFLIAPAVVAAESVEQFSAEYTINRDGTVSVVETITYDFSPNDRRGIYRDIILTPAQSASEWWRERYVDFSLQSVTRNGQSEPYQITGGNTTRIRVGDPDIYHTGTHTYSISYTLAGALSYTGQPEFYWNVTGDEWSVPIESVVAIVRAEPGVLTDQRACYQGRPRSTESCAIGRTTDTQSTFISGPLAPGEQLTIAQALNGAAVETLVVTRIAPLIPILGVVFTWFPYLLWTGIRYRRANDPKPPVIAQYEPYQDFPPMFSGVLLDGALHPQDITAGIVYLAEQGIIKIRHVDKKILGLFSTGDYEIERRAPVASVPHEGARILYELLFTAPNNSRWSALSTASQPADSEVQVVSLSELAKHRRRNARLIQQLRTLYQAKLEEEQIYERSSAGKLFGRQLLLVFGLAVLLVLFLPFGLGVGLGIGVFIATLVLSIILFQARRTARGYEAKYHLLGFKDFLQTTDAERFSFHNAPQKSPETFMQYLPYAIAFGVEKEWAAAFSDIMIPAPDWYEDATGAGFSAAAFSADMGGLSQSLSRATSPSNSGSSGGGSAGGGGGGGGGGSW